MQSKIMIIPGNPPSRYFYEIWKQELESLFLSPVMIEAYPTIFDVTDANDYLMQIEKYYQARFICHQPTIVIGHSVGGYFALKLLEQFADNLNQCFLLFPFLHSPGLKGQVILRAMNQIYDNMLFKKNYYRTARILSRFVPDLKKLTQNELEASLALAACENQTIRKLKSNPICPSLSSKVAVLYTQQDTWCTSRVVRSLDPFIKKTCLDVSHGFVVTDKERLRVNQWLLAQGR